MAHLIYKDALVTKIKKLKEENRPNSKSISEYIKGGIYGFDLAIEKTLSAIDALEVKEVDLKKEAELIANGIMIGVQANKYNTVVYNTQRNDFNHSHLMLAARKGIEFGLKAKQK